MRTGCIGGISPRALVNISFYSERAAIPLRTSIPIIDGKPGAEIVLESKPGLVRELEVDVTMDLNTALSFHIWLREKLEFLRIQMNVSDEQWNIMLGKAK
jgi:hypothetical protein